MDDAVNIGLHYILRLADTPGPSVRHSTPSLLNSCTTSSPSSQCPPLPVSGLPAFWLTGGSKWSWEASHPAPKLQALVPPKGVSSTHSYSPSTLMTASLWTPRRKFLKYVDNSTDRKWSSWFNGAVRITWTCIHLRLLRWQWTSAETCHHFPASPSFSNTVHTTDTFKSLGTTNFRHLKCSLHNTTVHKKSQQRLYFLRQLRKLNQVCPLHFHHCLVQFCHQTRQAQIAMDS